MKFSIGHRLFASVLLAILAVVASAVYLLRQNVLAGFGDYATAIELDRLEELSSALALHYRADRGWTFIPDNNRRDWIAGELARLRQVRAAPAAAAVAPVAPGSPAAAVSPAAPVAPLAPLVPPAPPEPALPPLPPPQLPEPGAGPPPPLPDEALPLARRISLLDANDGWLAGRQPDETAHGVGLARRPIEVDGHTVGWLAVKRSAHPNDAMAYAFLEQLRGSLWLIVGVAVLLSAVAAILLAGHFRRPIRALAAGAAGLAEGRFELRLQSARSDELGDLARHFNALAERLAGAEEERRQWVADTSHELRTPLAVLRAQLEALQDGVRSATPVNVDAMLRQVLALSKLIDELYALARADVGALDCRLAPLDLWQLAAAEAGDFGERLDAAGLVLDLGPAPPDATVLADPDRMRQVFDNLFENSLRYTAPGGHVRLHAHSDGERLRLHLDDSAPGVPDSALERLADRFYRVDASRSRAHGGAGLGLALCRRLLEAQGASLHFAHAPLGGLRATIVMPLARHVTESA